MNGAHIDFEQRLDGFVWRLPPRKLGKYRNLGWIGMGVGLFMGVFTLGFLLMPLRGMMDGPWLMRGFLLIFVVAGGAGLFVANRVFLCGLALVRERIWTEVRLIDGGFVVIERLGGWSPRRNFSAGLTEELVVCHSAMKNRLREEGMNPEENPGNELVRFPEEESFALEARSEAKDFDLAVGYSKALLQELAGQVAERLPGGAPGVEEVLVREEDPAAAEARKEEESYETPPWTEVLRRELPGGVAFAVPARGVDP